MSYCQSCADLQTTVQRLEAQLAEAQRLHQRVDESRLFHFEKAEQAREQRDREHAISFAFGNTVLDNPAITREMVEQAYDKLHPKAEPQRPRVTHKQVVRLFWKTSSYLGTAAQIENQFIADLRDIGIDVEVD